MDLTLGQRGEVVATRLLAELRLVVVERNYRCRLGEVDIVARDGAGWLFIEVKTRSGLGYGRPAEAVDRAKQRKLVRLAQHYLLRRSLSLDAVVEFGVVEVVYARERGVYSAHLIRHAF